MDPDLLQTYTNEQAQQLVKEFTELGNDMERSIMADTGTEEMEQTLRGLAYFYEKREFPSPIVSLRNCIEMNQASLANFLIRHGKVSADEHIGSNFTLLHLAAMRNRPSFVPILVACGLDINQKGGNVGFTPLHEAIRAGSYEATIALLDAGADIEFCSDSFSNTPPFSPFELALQCPNRDSKMLSLLLDRGAKYGHTTQSQ
jgi:ankyrin repeat protein